MSMFTDWDSPI
jgi:serine/threonine protein kinase